MIDFIEFLLLNFLEVAGIFFWDFLYYFLILLREVVLNRLIQVGSFLFKLFRLLLVFCIILVINRIKVIHVFANFLPGQSLELFLFILLQTLEQLCEIIINFINQPSLIQFRQLLLPFVFFLHQIFTQVFYILSL